MVVREERPEDIAAIHNLNAEAFGQEAEANLVDKLRAEGKVSVSFVAEDAGRIVGHILFTTVTISAGSGEQIVQGLGPMAVLPRIQRSGVGGALVQKGIEWCALAGYAGIVVVGHPGYYPRFGFVPASRYGIRCEFDVPDSVFMALELRPGSLAPCAGTARYLPEFKEV